MLNRRMSPGRGGPVLIAACLLATLAGCGSGDDSTDAAGPACEKEYTIGLSVPVSEGDFIVALKKRVQAIADEHGCITMLFDNTTANNLETQRATLESWVTQQIDAIVVLPVDAGAVASLQTQAQANGTKWLTYASKGEGADGSTGFDSDASGQAASDFMTSWVAENNVDPASVTAMVTTLTPLEEVAGGRWKYPLQGLADLGVEVVSQQDCADRNCGLQITEDVLRAHPDLRIVVGLNDDAALGAARAFTNAGIAPETVLVIGQDGTPEALQAIKDGGPLKASIGIDLEELAQAIVAMPVNAVDGTEPVDDTAGVVVASVDDPEGLDKLIASYGG